MKRINVQMPDEMYNEVKGASLKSKRSVSAEVVSRLGNKSRRLKVLKSRTEALNAVEFFAENNEGLHAQIDTDDDLASWLTQAIETVCGGDDVQVSVNENGFVISAEAAVITSMNLYLF